MEVLFKKYFWAIVLATLVMTSYLTGSAASLYIGDKILGDPADTDEVLDSLGGGSPELPDWGIDAPFSPEQLMKRGVFDSDKLDYEPEIGDDDEGKDEEDSLEIGEVIPETELDLELVGTILTETPALNMASMQVEGEGMLLAVGSSLIDGKAVIVRIEQRFVLLEEGDELKIVKLWSDKEPKSKKSKYKKSKYSKSKKVAKKTSSKTNYKAHVKNTGKYEWTIDKQMLDEELKDLTKIGKQAKIVPNYKGGKYEGFKLIGVRPKSLYRAIGIRSGDVILRVNGDELNSPNKAISLFDQLKGSSSIELDILRGGQPVTMNYKIQ